MKVPTLWAMEDFPLDSLDPFSAGQALAEEVVEQILIEGGKKLYETYIEKKSFTFAAEAFTKLIVAELQMCFVLHDPGEPDKTSAPALTPLPRPGTAPSEPCTAVEVAEAAEAVPAAEPEKAAEKEQTHAHASRKAPQALDLASEPFAEGAASPKGASGWSLEPEPSRCRIDTWARASIPTRTRLVTRDQGVDDSKKRQNPLGGPRQVAGRSPQSRTASRASNASGGVSRPPTAPGAMGATREEPTEAQGPIENQPRMFPIQDEVEEDEEETNLREMKEREAKRRQDEEIRQKQKALHDAEDAAKMSAVKDSKNQPFTYDSEGHILMVQPVQVNKLPSTVPVPSFVFKRADGRHEEQLAPVKKDLKPVKPTRDVKKSGAAKSDAAASFKKFASQQPSMIEAMVLAPGVQLDENGATKKGPPVVEKGSKKTLSRKDYDELVQKGNASLVFHEPEPLSARSHPPASIVATAIPAGPVEPRPVEAASGGNSPRVVRQDLGAELVPHPPPTPRPAAPPLSARKVQKRDALGYSLSMRERAFKDAPNGASSRFPKCAAKPPLGATMGHGLLPLGEKYEEFFFPLLPSQGLEGSISEEEVGGGTPRSGRSGSVHSRSASLQTRSIPLSPRIPVPQGQIISTNVELKRRFFGAA